MLHRTLRKQVATSGGGYDLKFPQLVVQTLSPRGGVQDGNKLHGGQCFRLGPWCSGSHAQHFGRVICMHLLHSVTSHGWLETRHRGFEPPNTTSQKYDKHFLEPLTRPHSVLSLFDYGWVCATEKEA